MALSVQTIVMYLFGFLSGLFLLLAILSTFVFYIIEKSMESKKGFRYSLFFFLLTSVTGTIFLIARDPQNANTALFAGASFAFFILIGYGFSLLQIRMMYGNGVFKEFIGRGNASKKKM